MQLLRHSSSVAKSLSEMRELNGRPVLIFTLSGKQLPIGHVVVTEDAGRRMVQRLEVTIETGEMKCRVGLPPEEWDKIAESWDGKTMRYVLRASDDFWDRPSAPPARDESGKGPVLKKE
jgi:hypothetical protein